MGFKYGGLFPGEPVRCFPLEWRFLFPVQRRTYFP
uniref:Uncharacterized protein n=1 Tax=Anguilla anguilla TaxID=7936 RepID=A0A0E9XEC4_ANGAN